jgi:hypothetical protein
MRALWSAVAAIGLVAAADAKAQDPTLEWGLPSSGLLHGSKAAIENQPCCGPSRNDRVNNLDRAALAKWSGVAARDGRTLMLKLAGNRTLKLTDCDDQTGCEADDTRIHRLIWTDETHVTFEGESPRPEDKPNTKQLLRVEGGKGQWQC